jgi:hypothetical protein
MTSRRALGDDSADVGIDRSVRDDVKLDNAQINTVLRGILMSQHHLLRTATLRIPHSGVDGVTGTWPEPVKQERQNRSMLQ